MWLWAHQRFGLDRESRPQLGGEVDSGYFSRLAHGAGVYHWLKSAGATAGWCPCILIIFCVSRALFKELEAERATETFHL